MSKRTLIEVALDRLSLYHDISEDEKAKKRGESKLRRANKLMQGVALRHFLRGRGGRGPDAGAMAESVLGGVRMVAEDLGELAINNRESLKNYLWSKRQQKNKAREADEGHEHEEKEGNMVCMPKKEFKKEHHRLLKVLKTGKNRKEELSRQSKEMKHELGESKRGLALRALLENNLAQFVMKRSAGSIPPAVLTAAQTNKLIGIRNKWKMIGDGLRAAKTWKAKQSLLQKIG